jgi:hypothetical protein
MTHDWGSNIVTIQENGTIKTIIVTKCLGGEVKRPKMLLCYDYQNGIIDEEEDTIFATKLELLLIQTIILLKTIKYVKTIDMEIMDTSVKTSNSKFKSRIYIT